jgi:post-segregation antitoxin (ccd killing protein)
LGYPLTAQSRSKLRRVGHHPPCSKHDDFAFAPIDAKSGIGKVVQPYGDGIDALIESNHRGVHGVIGVTRMRNKMSCGAQTTCNSTTTPLFSGLNTPCFRAIVLHGNENMNVTLKLPDELVREARHLAVNQSKSLSAWMASLVRRELEESSSENAAAMTLAEAMRVPGMPDSFYEKDFPLPDRRQTKHREFTFEPDED